MRYYRLSHKRVVRFRFLYMVHTLVPVNRCISEGISVAYSFVFLLLKILLTIHIFLLFYITLRLHYTMLILQYDTYLAGYNTLQLSTYNAYFC